MKTSTCRVKGCGRKAAAKLLCSSHYNQIWRGEPLRPLRPKGGLVRLAVRLRPETLKALEQEGPSTAGAARDVLEAWARRGEE